MPLSLTRKEVVRVPELYLQLTRYRTEMRRWRGQSDTTESLRLQELRNFDQSTLDRAGGWDPSRGLPTVAHTVSDRGQPGS